MTIQKLQTKYLELIEMEDPDDGLIAFKNLLLESDEEDVVDFHIKIWQEIEDEYLKEDVFSFFAARRDKKKVANYLFTKVSNKTVDPTELTYIIHIMGEIGHEKALEAAKLHYQSDNPELRLCCLNVFSLIGKEDELKFLKDRFENDKSDHHKTQASIAMRIVRARVQRG